MMHERQRLRQRETGRVRERDRGIERVRQRDSERERETYIETEIQREWERGGGEAGWGEKCYRRPAVRGADTGYSCQPPPPNTKTRS